MHPAHLLYHRSGKPIGNHQPNNPIFDRVGRDDENTGLRLRNRTVPLMTYGGDKMLYPKIKMLSGDRELL